MLNITEKNTEKWFQFSKDEKYLLRYLPDSDREKVDKLEIQNDLNKYKDEKLSDKERDKIGNIIDDKNKIVNKIVAENVIDWEGIIDENKNKIPCNDEYKSIVFFQLGVKSKQRLGFIVDIQSDAKNFYEKTDLKN